MCLITYEVIFKHVYISSYNYPISFVSIIYHYPQTLLAYSFSARNADLSILSGILVKCVQLIFRFMFFSP